MALVYATGGRESLIEDVVVDIASSVVTVKATRAGAYGRHGRKVNFVSLPMHVAIRVHLEM